MDLRRRYHLGIEALLKRGGDEGAFVVENPKITAFAIIEMCEAIPTWFRSDDELSAGQVAALYGEYAVRIAGARTHASA